MIRLLIDESDALSCQLLLVFFAHLFNSHLAHVSPGIAACAASYDGCAAGRKGPLSQRALRVRASIVVVAACALRCGGNRIQRHTTSVVKRATRRLEGSALREL